MLNHAAGYMLHVIIYLMHSGTNLHLVQELPQSYYVNVNNREDCSVRYGSLITSYIYIYIYKRDI